MARTTWGDVVVLAGGGISEHGIFRSHGGPQVLSNLRAVHISAPGSGYQLELVGGLAKLEQRLVCSQQRGSGPSLFAPWPNRPWLLAFLLILSSKPREVEPKRWDIFVVQLGLAVDTPVHAGSRRPGIQWYTACFFPDGHWVLNGIGDPNKYNIPAPNLPLIAVTKVPLVATEEACNCQATIFFIRTQLRELA